MKWKISWWIHGAGQICRGYDILEADVLDKDVVEDLIEEDLEWNIPLATGCSFTPNLPKFHKKHNDLMIADRHTCVSNFGVILVNKLKE